MNRKAQQIIEDREKNQEIAKLKNIIKIKSSLDELDSQITTERLIKLEENLNRKETD